MKKSFMKTICLALFAAIFLTVASSCKKGSGDKGNIDEQKTLKIGVLREDDSSDEASAWEKYLKTVGKDLNMTVDFHNDEQFFFRSVRNKHIRLKRV